MKERTIAWIRTLCLTGLAFLFLLSFSGNAICATQPIKIGVVLPVTGWGAALGQPTKEAIAIVADETNHRGGVLGRTLELYVEDDQSSPTNAAVAVTKLVRDTKVSMVIGSALTVLCMPMLPFSSVNKSPMCLSGQATILRYL